MDRELMRRNNMRLILASVLKAGEVSRACLAESTGMSAMSVGRIADELIGRGLLQEREKSEVKQNAAGRPPKALSLPIDKLLCCGVYLDKRILYLGITDPLGNLKDMEAVPYASDGELLPERVLPWIAEQIGAYLNKWRGKGLLNKVGVAVPGIVDIHKGDMLFSANLHWRNVAVTEHLKERLPDYCFYLENDTKALAQAVYRFRNEADTQNMVLLSLGDGIGSAAILNGQICRSAQNMAGEIGHIILNPAGKVCECGQTGCLQTNLAQSAILNEARSVYPDITMDELLTRSRRGEPFAAALINQVVGYISTAINLLANTYAPEVIVLSGSTIWDHPLLCSMVERNYRNRLNEYMQDAFKLRFDAFGISGYIVGAGAIAFERVVDALCVVYA
jgi:N-acetylglucosamine repressor